MNGGMIRMRNAFSPLLQSAEGYQNHSITRSSDPRDRAAGRAWEPGQALFPVVGMAGVDRPGTVQLLDEQHPHHGMRQGQVDRKSTRLNSSHLVISYAVFCLKKKK